MNIKIQQKSLAVWTYCKAFLLFDELGVCSPALGVPADKEYYKKSIIRGVIYISFKLLAELGVYQDCFSISPK